MTKNFRRELGELADPTTNCEPVNIDGLEKDFLVKSFRDMVKIRRAEEAIADLVVSGKAHCPCHLSIGQEAIPVGISAHLRNTDRVFGAHRSHGHYLALDASLNELMAEVLGKKTGCSGGMGGSMHLFARDQGFYGSVPIVAGTVPLAVGAGLAAKLDKGTDIAVSYFGDGSSEEGGVHESLNMAVNYDLPVLFVCENNLFSSHLDIDLRQPSDRVSRYADGHCIPQKTIDGNDIATVYHAAGELIDSIRNGAGPAFLEVVTYRWRGHVGPNEDIDVGVHRKTEDIVAWKKRDPVKRLQDAMIANGISDQTQLEALVKDVESEIEESVRLAEMADYPDSSSLEEYVYA